MSHPRRKYDPEFKAGAVRIVRETRRPICEVARELGIGAGTLGLDGAADESDDTDEPSDSPSSEPSNDSSPDTASPSPEPAPTAQSSQ
jgi:transposase